jgi:hypothetical protein
LPPPAQNEAFRAALEDLRASAAWRAADTGEVAATAARVRGGDAAGWVAAWSATAEHARDVGDRALARGRRTSAREAHLRASTYFAAAATQAGEEEGRRLWERQREAWDRAVPLFDPPGEPFEIPYEGTTLPAWLFRAPGATGRRPLVILNNGTREATTAMLVRGGGAAAARGHHWMTFDGPGQNAALLRQGLALRPDWEHVIARVLDRVTRFGDVDRGRVALIGTGEGGLLVARAAAYERRLAATVADPGIWDLRAPLVAVLDPKLRAMLERGDRDAFDDQAERLPAPLEAALRPLGIESPFDGFRALEAYTLDDPAQSITTPLLVTEGDGEPWAGDAQRVYEAARGPKALARFTAYEGAGSRRTGLAVREQRIFDWLEEMLAV